MKQIKEGAEAKLFLAEFEGKKAIVKERVNKDYRIRALNDYLIKKRTKQEYSLLKKASILGIKTPHTYSLDAENGSFIIEFINGERLRDSLKESKNKIGLCKQAGRIMGLLHKNNIIHGDLTTSNFIVNQKKELVVFDFGLGYISHKIEDKATDLLNMKKTFQATHSSIKNGWESMAKEYCKNYGSGKEVLGKLLEIEKRARYK